MYSSQGADAPTCIGPWPVSPLAATTMNFVGGLPRPPSPFLSMQPRLFASACQNDCSGLGLQTSCTSSSRSLHLGGAWCRLIFGSSPGCMEALYGRPDIVDIVSAPVCAACGIATFWPHRMEKREGIGTLQKQWSFTMQCMSTCTSMTSYFCLRGRLCKMFVLRPS